MRLQDLGDHVIESFLHEWVILELMGHRRLAGLLSAVEIAGAPFLRLDVPGKDGTVATQFYAPAAVYCITPTTEEMARLVAERDQPEPVQRWELRPPILRATSEDYEEEVP
jgi:hypothetical protein